MEIQNKVVIVTGASQGIGLAAAKYLSKLGAKIVIAARSADLITGLQKELPGSLAVVTDMRKLGDIKNLVKKTLDEYGRIDILINNAGQGMYGLVENMNIDHYREIMELNVYSVVEMMQQIIPIMKKQSSGVIVNVSSALTKMYVPGISAYSSTKYALNAISLIARQELEKDHIIVCVVEPNMTATNFGQNSIGPRPNWGASGRTMPQVDSAEKVAEVIADVIKSEKAEVRVGY